MRLAGFLAIACAASAAQAANPTVLQHSIDAYGPHACYYIMGDWYLSGNPFWIAAPAPGFLGQDPVTGQTKDVGSSNQLFIEIIVGHRFANAPGYIGEGLGPNITCGDGNSYASFRNFSG